jgi:hypothetical protein
MAVQKERGVDDNSADSYALPIAHMKISGLLPQSLPSRISQSSWFQIEAVQTKFGQAKTCPL